MTPTQRRARVTVPSEHQEQCAVVRWAALMEPRHQELGLLFGTLNGVRLTIGQAVKAKAAGNKAGVPDLWLPVRRAHYETLRGGRVMGRAWYAGLCIELKRKSGGVTSPAQRFWHEALSAQGYRVEVCRGAEAAIRVLCDYLNIPEPNA